MAVKFEVYEDKAGESRFRLEAGNKRGSSVKTNAASAVVDDKTV